MSHTAPTGLIALQVPVPPMLEAALRYDGPARWVSFWWEPLGDEARWSDGRFELRADWHAWRIFTEHHTVQAALAPYNLGSSETQATERLLEHVSGELDPDLLRRPRLVLIAGSLYLAGTVLAANDELPS